MDLKNYLINFKLVLTKRKYLDILRTPLSPVVSLAVFIVFFLIFLIPLAMHKKIFEINSWDFWFAIVFLILCILVFYYYFEFTKSKKNLISKINFVLECIELSKNIDLKFIYDKKIYKNMIQVHNKNLKEFMYLYNDISLNNMILEYNSSLIK